VFDDTVTLCVIQCLCVASPGTWFCLANVGSNYPGNTGHSCGLLTYTSPGQIEISSSAILHTQTNIQYIRWQQQKLPSFIQTFELTLTLYCSVEIISNSIMFTLQVRNMFVLSWYLLRFGVLVLACCYANELLPW